MECQRLYRLALIDLDANRVEPGEMLSDQRRYREFETFMTDDGKRYRVRAQEWEAVPEGFDGVLVVEFFPG